MDRGVQLKAVLPGIAGAGEQYRNAADLGVFDEVEGLQLCERGRGNFGQNLLSQRTLQSEQQRLIGDILQADTAEFSGEMLLQPLEVLVDIGGVHDEHVALMVQAVDEQIIYYAAIRIEHQGILRCTIC